MNFLIVDDSATMRKIVTVALGGAGHSYAEAENGKIALEKARGTKFDCVILDVNMPEMNGIEFLKARAADPGIAKLPVIVLTTQDEEALKNEALSLGAKAFLVKPFQKETLLATVGSVVGA
ncbi:MAG TPA: response regulator [Rectinemataceae bacterium]|nr:response regulator [Rectinemataceae bacterium]